MSMSNIEYFSLKKRKGLHNWGFMSSKDEFDFDLDELEAMDMDVSELQSPELLQQNSYGEYYALQDYEE